MDLISLTAQYGTGVEIVSTIRNLFEKGQSIWCDNISRGMIDGGELQRLIELGIVGVTSNPSIFMKAISGGGDYDARISELAQQGLDAMGIYEGLVIPDIADAADMLHPVYEGTHGLDGYVSLEVNPKLAFDTEGTIAEARRLHAELNRPNILIKVPATPEGIPAIKTLISEGISVNVTLIFAIEVYEQVMGAYLDGLRAFMRSGGAPRQVASVASFFVSRVDSAVDKKLDALKVQGRRVDALYGQAANANAKLAYERFTQVFDNTGDWGAIERAGARVQRPLWASTSTKNPDYPTTLYVDDLVGLNTVNTLPPATIEAVLKGPELSEKVTHGWDEARKLFTDLEALGINMNDVTDQLMTEGVKLFADAFDDLLKNIEEKQQRLSPTV